ncbi:glycosyltransferase [Gracilibacillus halophilus]|nr:nucleotide disphospho-sugar-binding domain-containing protein [Gracilibacillus halophilus]
MNIKETIIFAPETFNLAETTRSIEVAKECSHVFHCIFMGYSKKYSYLIEESNFTFIHLEPHLSDKQITQIMNVDQMNGIKHPFTYEHIKERVQNEKRLIKIYQPVSIVIGTTLSMFISSRVCNTPLVYIKPLAYTRPYFEEGYLPSPFTSMNLLAATIKKLFISIALRITYKPKSFTKVAKEENVSLPKYTIDALDADYNLITTTPEISQVYNLPDHYQYIGPVYAKLDVPIPKFFDHLPTDQPIIYFAMGSSGSPNIIVKLLHILSELKVTVVCPMKRMIKSQLHKLSFNENIILCDFLPAHKISKFIDLSIIHGGEGTVQTACLTGKPFLGFGLQQEQRVNINQCVRFGNALSFRKKDFTKARMEQLINHALSTRTIKEKALEIQQVLKDINGPENAAKFLIKHFTVT